MSFLTIDTLDEAGREAEILVDAKGAPSFGDWFTDEDGVRRQRVPNVCKSRVKNYTFTTNAIPFTKEATKNAGWEEPPHRLPDGTAAFESRKQVQEYEARSRHNPHMPTFTHDPDGNE